jgi:hypothetical protein
MYGSGTPIFVPQLWPHGHYNTRYGLAVLPLLAMGAAGLVALMPYRARGPVAAALVAAVTLPWLAYPKLDNLICWKESKVNSDARRAWTSQAAEIFKSSIRPGDEIFMCFGDLTGILRNAEIPLRRTVHEGDDPLFNAATGRPDLFLWQQWAVAISADAVSTAIAKAQKNGPRYQLVRTITVPGASPIEIYHRDESPRKLARRTVEEMEIPDSDEDSFHESTRSEERLLTHVGSGRPTRHVE